MSYETDLMMVFEHKLQQAKIKADYIKNILLRIELP